MKVIIFGANGRTGLHLVAQSLEKGYQVTAFSRNPDTIKIEHKALTCIKGDALNLNTVENAVKNHDAVICALGMKSIIDSSMLRSNATKNIISAMHTHSISRLVCLSSYGAGDSYNTLPLYYKYFIAPVFMHWLFQDHNAQEKIIFASNLNFTLVRPPGLTDGVRTGQYQCGKSAAGLSLKMKISRIDTAEFMLAQLEQNKYERKTPFISY